MNGEALSACSSRAGKNDRLPCPAHFLEQLEDRAIIEKGVEVVHFLWVGTIGINGIYRNALAEISLEAIHPLRQQGAKPVGIPGARTQVSEVNDSHARLPGVNLPDISVGTPKQVTLRCCLSEEA
ncbi:MAG: hypothetical protein BWY63_01040 [Chloroflexi bacterium ADurb.Bin360]|nr:MAG: hypothetical protein BWY63_01040 [Chloroflexi bacterium ADurb.Bin360]